MVEIIVNNLSGLYMGPIVEIAASLVFPCNDNKRISHSMDDAIALMNRMIETKPEVLNNPSLKDLSDLMEDAALFESEPLTPQQKEEKMRSILYLVSDKDI